MVQRSQLRTGDAEAAHGLAGEVEDRRGHTADARCALGHRTGETSGAGLGQLRRQHLGIGDGLRQHLLEWGGQHRDLLLPWREREQHLSGRALRQGYRDAELRVGPAQLVMALDLIDHHALARRQQLVHRGGLFSFVTERP
jgi:hypothetical protein